MKWLVLTVSLLLGALTAWLFIIRSARKNVHDDDPDDRFGAAALRPVEAPATTGLLDAETTENGPYGAGSVAVGPDGDAPSTDYRIKGNESSMLYHTPDSPYYDATAAEVWFRTEDDARRAGFAPWRSLS